MTLGELINSLNGQIQSVKEAIGLAIMSNDFNAQSQLEEELRQLENRLREVTLKGWG
jgi:hypothetical protein